MEKELLEKYCNNRCTEDELVTVMNWFDQKASTSEGKALLFRMWEELSDEDKTNITDYDLILDRIHHKVNLSRSNNLLLAADQDPVKYKKRKAFISTLTRIAAVLMLPVLGFSIYLTYKNINILKDQSEVNMSYNEVFSSVDAITKVTLPDGSDVWLNHSSILKYPAMFKGKSRTVELSGEGFFVVTKNPNVPFVVKTGGIEVLALGTTFNILAYPDEDKVETSLIEGIVNLQRFNPSGKIISLAKMKPKDLVTYHKAKSEIDIRTIADDRYFSWKDGKLIFNEEPMGEVVKKLSRWFNVEFQINDPKLLELTFTGTFRNETLPQVMELFARISPVSYSISNRQEKGDGSFSKRKVVLSYRKYNPMN